MDVQGVARRTFASVALLTALFLAAPSIAQARHVPTTLRISSHTVSTTAVAIPDTPVLVTNLNKPPSGFKLTAAEVEGIAARNVKVRAELRRHRDAIPYEYTKGLGQWQVSWFSAGRHQKELLQVYVDDYTGKVTQVWTGYQVAWTMARGYPGAFGERVNAVYIWLPLCVLFIAPFLPWRRRRFSLLHLDLAMLLFFSVSLAFFNHAKIGLSVPLAYPPLLYLLVRMLLLAFGRGRPREPLRLAVPASWLVVALVFLIGFRVGLDIVNGNVIDVGYAGVIGANKVIHGDKLYGNWPSDNAYGDTYGPVNYYAYVPFRVIFGWSGTWDSLPAAHAAAIAFDLLTMLGLFLLGRRVRGPTLGVALAYLWAAFPFTLFVLCSDSNDSLVAMLIVAALLVITSAPARGVGAALAGLTKFAPFALGPLFLRGTGDWPGKRSIVAYLVAFAATTGVTMLPVFLDHNFTRFWHDTIVYQANRPSPFSVWGLWGWGTVKRVVQVLTVLLAIGAAFLPRRRGLIEVAALGSAIMIGVELCLEHWFYLYIVWFLPLVLLALLGSFPGREGSEPAAQGEPSAVPVAAPPAFAGLG